MLSMSKTKKKAATASSKARMAARRSVPEREVERSILVLEGMCDTLERLNPERLDDSKRVALADAFANIARRLNTISRKINRDADKRTTDATRAKVGKSEARLLIAAADYKRDLTEYPRSSADERRERVRRKQGINRRTFDGYMSRIRRTGLLSAPEEDLRETAIWIARAWKHGPETTS
jgi:hypothetical protein